MTIMLGMKIRSHGHMKDTKGENNVWESLKSFPLHHIAISFFSSLVFLFSFSLTHLQDQ